MSPNLRLAVLAGTVAVAACAIPASAQAANYSGRCSMKGTLHYDKGVTFKNADNTGSLTASGLCSGGQTGRITATISGPVGCTGSPSTNHGTGTFTVGSQSFPLKVDVDVKLPTGKLGISVAGGSGAGGGSLQFVDVANLPSMARCPGQGLNDAKFSLPFRTSSPLDAGSGASPAPGPAPSVKITVGRSQKSRTIAKRGYVSVKCRPSASGRCSVRVTRGRTLIASGSGTTTVHAKLTRAGRKALRSKRFKATVTASAGGAKIVRTVTFSR